MATVLELNFPKFEVDELRAATHPLPALLGKSVTFFSTLKDLHQRCLDKMKEAKSDRFMSGTFDVAPGALKCKGNESHEMTSARYVRVLRRQVFPGVRVDIHPIYTVVGDPVSLKGYRVYLAWSEVLKHCEIDDDADY